MTGPWIAGATGRDAVIGADRSGLAPNTGWEGYGGGCIWCAGKDDTGVSVGMVPLADDDMLLVCGVSRLACVSSCLDRPDRATQN